MKDFYTSDSSSFYFLFEPYTMKRPLTHTQCIILTLFWALLCFLVLTSVPRIDGPLIVAIVISGALVFIPITKSIKARNK